jgi:YfiH family protein
MQIFQSKLLKTYQNLSHTFTTKADGNLAFHVEDNKESVLRHHQELAQRMHYDLNKLVHMKQIHSNIVKVIDKNNNFKNPPICDALITNKKDTPLMVMVADCSPLLFYDPNKEIIAVAHAGREGAFQNIVQKVIDSFIEDFQSNTENIIVAIGPAISAKNYKVNKIIYEEAKKKNLAFALINKGNNYYIDIRKILKKQLLDAGVKSSNIDISMICNKDNEAFFSYREQKQTGRFAGIILMH